MCGIVGIWAYNGEPCVERDELQRMRDAMSSRGPDGADMWIAESRDVGLGHRRLAILDLSDAGAQPMRDPDTGNVIVYNGEIYNYRALRERLIAQGVAFRSRSDTEVVLHLYGRYGEAMVEHLRGMFAFAIWDPHEQALFLARDPFGIKPLYYADNGQTFRFASQVKALAAGGAISTEPSAAGWVGFHVWGHVPEPWTWLAAVQALPAGCTLRVRRGGLVPSPRCYFDLREEIVRAESSPVPEGDAVEAALESISDSVCHHLVGDVPVGVFLSAGRDSTLIAALAARHAGEPPRTITLCFEEYRGTPNDEAPGAEAVAQLLAARHRTVRITPRDFDEEREHLLAAMDQPSIDGVNAYFVSRAAAQAGLKVALSGLGGDELFGGYSSFMDVPRLVGNLQRFDWAPWFGRGLRLTLYPLLRRVGRPKWAGLVEYGTSLPRAYILRRALCMPWEVHRLIDPDVAHQGLAELALEENLQAQIRGIRDPRAAVMALEMSCYMRNQLLRDVDWAGMAHSVEIRVPLIDVELLRRWLPIGVRCLPLNRQRLLEASVPTIADILRARPKSGFGIPVQRWVRPARPANCAGVGLRPWARSVAGQFFPPRSLSRVVALLIDAHGGIGGIAKFNRDLLAAVNALPECRKILVYPRLVSRDPEPIPPKVQYRCDAARGKRAFVTAVLGLIASVREPADLVICCHLNLLPLAWLLARIKRCPVLLIVHGVEAWHPHRNAMVRYLLRRTDRVAAVSRYTAERLAAWSGLPWERFRILPNCIDLCEYSPRPRDLALARRYGLEDRRILLTVGRMAAAEKYKGFDEVLEVLPELIREEPRLCYVIVGDGDDRPRLERKAATLGLADHVVFAGYVSEEEKKAWYTLADAFVMPSRGEGFGIVFLEAMASGVPAVGSSVDGSREALLDGRLGLLVDPGNRAALVAAVREALSRPRGRPEGLDYFSLVAYRERLAALVRETVR